MTLLMHFSSVYHNAVPLNPNATRHIAILNRAWNESKGTDLAKEDIIV